MADAGTLVSRGDSSKGLATILHQPKQQDNTARMYQMMLGMQAKKQAQEAKDFAKSEAMVRELDKVAQDKWIEDTTNLSELVKDHMSKAAELLELKPNTPEYVKKQMELQYNRKDINDKVELHNEQKQEFGYLTDAIRNKSFGKDFDTDKLKTDLQNWLKTPFDKRQSIKENLKSYEKPYEFNPSNTLDNSLGKEFAKNFYVPNPDGTKGYSADKWNLFHFTYYNKGHTPDGQIIPDSDFARDLKAFSESKIAAGQQPQQYGADSWENAMMKNIQDVSKGRGTPSYKPTTSSSSTSSSSLNFGSKDESGNDILNPQQIVLHTTDNSNPKHPKSDQYDVNAKDVKSLDYKNEIINNKTYDLGNLAILPVTPNASIPIPKEQEKDYPNPKYKAFVEARPTEYIKGTQGQNIKNPDTDTKWIPYNDVRSKVLSKKNGAAIDKYVKEQEDGQQDSGKAIKAETLTSENLPTLKDGQLVEIKEGEYRKWNKKKQKLEVIK